MRINFTGHLVDEKEIRAGFIGCGSHSFRNIYPTFQFARVNLVATCDLSLEKAQTYAKKFGAENAYADYKEMLEKEDLDAVFVVTGYDKDGRPVYPKIAVDCLNAGCHVWMEKPPAATVQEIEDMDKAAKRNNKIVMVGFKKMFFPANEKARELAYSEDFGQITMVSVQYPQYIPTVEDFRKYFEKDSPDYSCVGFLDHLCHPMSLIVYLMGMPKSFYYERSFNGSGYATFRYANGALVSLTLTNDTARNGGMERTSIYSDKFRHIVVENNVKVSYHKDPPGLEYGASPSFYTGTPSETTAVWEPEFSLGNLYNKGLFLLGYYSEVAEFANAILENRQPVKCTLQHAKQITKIFELFAKGPGKVIEC